MYSSIFPIPSLHFVSNITITYANCSQYTTQIHIFFHLFHLLHTNRNFSLYNISILFVIVAIVLVILTAIAFLIFITASFTNFQPLTFITRIVKILCQGHETIAQLVCIFIFHIFFIQNFHFFFLRLSYVVVRDVFKV